MIRPFIRCVRMYQHLQRAQSNHIILSMNRDTLIGRIKNNHYSSLEETRTTEETKLISSNMVDFLHKALNCRMAQANEICIAHPKLVSKKIADVSECVELLLKKGVTKTVIIDNPEVLALRDYGKKYIITTVRSILIKEGNANFRRAQLQPWLAGRYET